MMDAVATWRQEEMGQENRVEEKGTSQVGLEEELETFGRKCRREG